MNLPEPMVRIDKLWSVFKTAGVPTVIHQDLDLDVAQASSCPSWVVRAAEKRCCCARCWGWKPRPVAR